MLNKGDLYVKGRCDGMGDPTPFGSYVRLVYKNDLASYGLVISEGEAASLVDELRGAISSKQPT